MSLLVSNWVGVVRESRGVFVLHRWSSLCCQGLKQEVVLWTGSDAVDRK